MKPETNMPNRSQTSWGTSLSREKIFFITAICCALFSRIGIFLTGYTSDDYAYALDQVDSTWHAIHQGRFLAPLVFSAVNHTGFTQPSLQWPLFIISLFAVAALISKIVHLTLADDKPISIGIAAAAIAASYPYLTSYYLFRMAILDQILVYSIVLLAMNAITDEKKSVTGRIILGSVIVGLGCGDNQLVFILFSICALAWLTRLLFAQSVMPPGVERKGSHGLWMMTIAPATILGSLLIYFPSIKLAQAITGIVGEKSYSIDASRGIFDLIGVDLRLVVDVLARGESIIPFYMKAVMLAVIVVLIIQVAIASWRSALLCVLFLLCGLIISVAPLAVGSGGHVARIFVGTGFALALFVSLSGNLVSKPKMPALALGILFLLYAGSGATMFYQQHLLSEWDQKEAWSIYTDIARQFDITESTHIHVINGSKIHGVRLSTYGDADYGVNESALRSDWSYAYPGLFKVATGKNLNVTGGTPDTCLNKPSWPKPGSIFSDAPSDIQVCL